jgi:hypothetical protein
MGGAFDRHGRDAQWYRLAEVSVTGIFDISENLNEYNQPRLSVFRTHGIYKNYL